MSKKGICLLGLFLLIGIVLPSYQSSAQTTEKKVVIQGFWWDYWNNNFPNGWTDYLAELAPRLKAMDIDAVWIPPSYKNAGTSSVGYVPFDHYDLGDKYQKGTTTTRFGTKDDFLRMVAIFHANGIEVIQDVVLNHVSDAGATDGSGGQDPEGIYSMATNDGYKNFRYVCHETPVPTTGENATEYLAREGRWPKNYHNFHPHSGHQTSSGEWASPYWGPDFCYGTAENGYANGYGQSTNATYNPVQNYNYNRDQARSWIQWFVKQTDVDGFRWDAVKHFPHFIVQDLSYNVKYNNGWANRGEAMFNVGEYVGGATELDTWVNDVQYSNSGSDELVGTFDFALRGAVYNMVSGGGNYDLSDIAGSQQSKRVTYYSNSNTYVHRTVGFVNNHDTFRPTKDADGNYTGWDSSNELAAHIHPEDGRLSAAYAIIFALDGNPMVFFEDLFNIGNTSKRYSHEPTNTTDLPIRDDIANIIWCHQNLDFKSGEYKVRWEAADLLVVERSNRAIIGINDNWNTWKLATVQTDFASGTVLKDFSGANSGTVTVDANGQVAVAIPPCDGTANFGRRGYAIYGPSWITGTYQPSRNNVTTQEWEMGNDLGDSHCSSLRQGGKTPDNSIEKRIAGKIFVEAGQNVSYELYPENSSNSLTVGLYSLDGTLLDSEVGTGSLSGSYTVASTGWMQVKVHNTADTYTGQKCWIKVAYQAPEVVDTDAYPAYPSTAIWTGSVDSNPTDCENWNEGFTPRYDMDVLIPAGAPNMPEFSANLSCQALTVDANAQLTMNSGTQLTLTGNFILNGTLLLRTYGGSQATLIDNGTITGTGSVQLEQYLVQDQWHYIASPVVGQTAQFLSGAYMKTFDETANNWAPYISNLSTVLQAQTGYAVWLTSSGLALYDGFPYTQAEGAYMSFATTKATDGFNFTGNPFPSAMDWDATDGWNNQNLGTQIWIWNPVEGQYGSYVAGNSGVGTNDVSNIIPVGQGFFVQATAAGSVQVDNRVRIHNNADVFKSSGVENLLKLRVTSISGNDECIVAFSPNGDYAFEPTLDAMKWMSPDLTKPSLFTVADGVDLSTNMLGLMQPNDSIPLSFVPGSESTYHIAAQYTESFPQATEIYLEDIFTSQWTDLKANPGYSFSSAGFTSSDRFVLHFSSVITEIGEGSTLDFSCVLWENDIYLSMKEMPNEELSLTLVDIMGREVYQADRNTQHFEIPKPTTPGIYLLRVEMGDERGTRKLFID